MEVQSEFLKPTEVAPLLGVGIGRVYQLISAGQIPAVRIGGSIRIPRSAWESWLRQKCEEAERAVAARET